MLQRSNPHSKQLKNPSTDLRFERTLRPDAPRTVYYERDQADRSVLHWGQRKLCLSEIEFLSLFPPPTRDQRCVVIYAGAAPGTHVRLLSDLFKRHLFVLVDPSNFTVNAVENRIITKQELFTDELAAQLKADYEGWHVLFISDVRSADYRRETKEENESRIAWDMDAQAMWHTLLRPVKSMLKFRLPYTAGTTRYLQGDIYLPVWGPTATTECRLIVDTYADETLYDHTEHEQKMFHFNTVTRPALYDHPFRGRGIDHCYDCTAEMRILARYHGGGRPADIARLSERLSASLSRTRTLADPNPDKEERIRVIRRRQWVNGAPAYEK